MIHGSEHRYQTGCRCGSCVEGHGYFWYWLTSNRAEQRRAEGTFLYQLPPGCLERRAAIDPTDTSPF